MNTVTAFETRVKRTVISASKQLANELDALVGAPWRNKRRRMVALDVAIITAALIVFVAWSQVAHAHLTNLICGERAALPLPRALIRLPGSLVAPAPRLPLWGALAQVMICFGLAEVHLGRKRTLVLIAATHAAATAFGRMFVAWGPHAPFHLGLPRLDRWERDTGPSAAVVGVGTSLGVLLRLPILTGALVGSMLLEAAVKPDLADREHLVAIAAGGVIAIAVQVGRPARREPTPTFAVG